MKKYRLKRDCYGFLNRYWTTGEVVDLDSSLSPPHHFELISSDDSESATEETEAPKKTKQTKKSVISQ